MKQKVALGNKSQAVVAGGNISGTIQQTVGSAELQTPEILRKLIEAVEKSQEIDDDARSVLFNQLQILTKQAGLPPQQQRKETIKSILAGLGATLSASGGLAEVWSTWGPSLRSFFGLS